MGKEGSAWMLQWADVAVLTQGDLNETGLPGAAD